MKSSETATVPLTFEEARRYAPGGVHTCIRNVAPHLLFTKAQGATITDQEGKEYIDYHGAFGPIVLGHNFPDVNRQVIETLHRADLFGVGTTDLEIRLGQKIVEHVPSAEKVLFCNAGSEATYHAIRLARAAAGRKKIIKFQGCYHGWHDYVLRNTLSVPEKIGQRDPGSAGMLDEAIDNTLVCTFNDLEDVERTFLEHRGEVAGVILEPIPHNIGCVLPEQRFLDGLRSLTRDHGALLIFDEVITGFRHSLGGYQKICGVTPDLTTLAKAMANGFPMAAICGRADLMDQFNTHPEGTVFFAGTYNGHSLSCAAALATIEVMENQNVHQHLFRLGDRMRQGLAEIISRLGVKATVAGFGSIFLIYFLEGPVRNYTDLMRNDAERFLAYRRGMVERGIFKLPLNLKRNHLSFSHTDEHVDSTLETAEAVLKNVVRS